MASIARHKKTINYKNQLPSELNRNKSNERGEKNSKNISQEVRSNDATEKKFSCFSGIGHQYLKRRRKKINS
jgi:hypothetical protein